jgi:hypothetical protein
MSNIVNSSRINSYTTIFNTLSNNYLNSQPTLSNSFFIGLEGATIKNIKLLFNGTVIFGTSNLPLSNNFGFLSPYASNTSIDNCVINLQGQVNCTNSFGGIVCDSINSTLSRNSFEMIGNILSTGSNTGGIVGQTNNSIIVFNNNSLTGNLQTSNNVGGIVGASLVNSNAIYGNINNMLGNIGTISNNSNISSIGGVIGQSITGDNINVNINAMQGNIISSLSNAGGIAGITNGILQYNYNSMIGNINGSGIINYCDMNSTVQFNINNMYGNTDKSAGINNIYRTPYNNISNNFISMKGTCGSNEINSNVSYSSTKYGFSNNFNIITKNVSSVIPNSSIVMYIDNIDTPILKNSITSNITIRGSNFIGPAPYWGLFYPNITNSNNTIIANNNLYRYNSNLVKNGDPLSIFSSNIDSLYFADGTNSNVLPTNFYRFINDTSSTSKNSYLSNLKNILSTNSNNLSSIVSAGYYDQINKLNQIQLSNINLDSIVDLYNVTSDTDRKFLKEAVIFNAKNSGQINLKNISVLTNTSINLPHKPSKTKNILVTSSNLVTLDSNASINLYSGNTSLYISNQLSNVNLVSSNLNLLIDMSLSTNNQIAILLN